MADDDAASIASDLHWRDYDINAQLSPDPHLFEQLLNSSDGGEAGGGASPTQEDALKIFKHAELDKTNMAAFFASVHEEGTVVSPEHLLSAVQNADKCQVNPGANITTGPDVFHIVSSPPQSSKTAFMMFLCLKDVIEHRMPSVVMVMNKKTELDRMERSLNHSSDYFAKYCKAIETGAIPSIRAIYPIGSNDRIEEYERCLKRWHQGECDECPIYFFLFNDNKLSLLATVIDKVRNIVGVDANGRVRLAFRHDEGDQISKTCNRSSVSEKSLLGSAVVANGLLDMLSSLYFATSTLPSMTLVPVPLGGRRPIYTEVEPPLGYVGYEESNRTGLRNTIVRLEMKSAGEYIRFVSTQDGAHAGMVFIGGSTKSGVKKGRTEQGRAAAIEFKTTPGWCMISWSSDELHVFAADPVLITPLRDAKDRHGNNVFREGPVIDPETHIDTGVIYFHGTGEISDYPALISFFLRQEFPVDFNLKTILFAKEMADRGTSICSTDHEHHLGSLYVSFSKNSTCEYIRQVAGRAAQIVVPQPGLEVKKIYLCATAATHETHRKAVLNCVYASDYLKKHFNEGTASLDGTLQDFCDRVDAAQCDSVQNETSGAMIFAKSTVSRGTLSTTSKKKVKQVEKLAKKRRVEIHHTYPFGEAADVPVPAVQAMVQEEEAAGPQPPVQEEASVFPPPLQIEESGAPGLPLLRFAPPTSPGRVDPHIEQNDAVPPLSPLNMMQPESPVQQNVVRHPLQPIVRQPRAGPHAPNVGRHPLRPIVRQPTAGPHAPTGDPALDMEELMLENQRDFIFIIKHVLEDVDEDSRMNGVGVHKMAREIEAKAHYYETMGAKVPAIEVVKYVWQNASNGLAEVKVVFEANGEGGGVFKKM